MTPIQEEFLNELKTKSQNKLTTSEYAEIYNKYCKLAIEHEVNNGADKHKSKAMGNYKIDAVLAGFISNQELINKIIDLKK